MNDKTMIHIAFGNMLDKFRSSRGLETKIAKLRLYNGTEYLTESMN